MTGSKKPESDSASQDNHLFIITVLSIVGAVFLLFAIVQFNSLFASRETVAASSTFAQTAREGYFQLVVLSVINFIMVLVFNRMQKGSSKASVITSYSIHYTKLYEPTPDGPPPGSRLTRG